ncbi:hypothetical protein LF599_04595 [Pseudodesulfovibrio thermohalotolerans]|uniref:hypothetical protein n=1 Tax=Pseudodesulfovibrio thermohalotolerans TaxID=2880651 RepID=UPI0024418177|nr:hypothetical protein [Pseudodesulfovibrio thermohalotolerans]WFS63447.1 hypothetical protein LF599_04595 [Pseudodesulfovibrio thermohalotolerans]
MSDKLNQDVRDETLANAMEAEEYEQDGRTVKRDPEKLLRVRDELVSEERARTRGHVFQRGGIFASRR